MAQMNNKSENLACGFNLIDLGLPSGTLWMDRNIGANSTSDCGLYFAWGEIEGYKADEIGKTKQFSWDDYKFGFNPITQYNAVEKVQVLEEDDDAAYQFTNGKCKMPSKEQFQELMDNTTFEWTTINGTNGALFTSKINGNSIFVPSCGYDKKGNLLKVDEVGNLWCNSLDSVGSYGAWFMNYCKDGCSVNYCDRVHSMSVRGVCYIGE